MPADIIVCVSTELEGALLKPHVPVLVTGVGAVNAAIALTQFLERNGARAILSCGIGGAYPSARLELAAAVWAESECYGDLGAASANGFLDMQALGFPLIPGAAPIYNIFPVTLRPLDTTTRPFITVNTCTGSDAAAREIEARTRGAVESMEGAAIAHVAALYEIPMGEVRGISNLAGNRDRGAWRVKEAAAAAQAALLNSIDSIL